MADQALEGLKVIELGRYVAGPYCGKVLADYGADVIKVEMPGRGDPARDLGPFPDDIAHPEKSGLFLYLNTNKRGVTLNIESETGRRMLLDLLRDADVLIESFPPGFLPALGLGYTELEKVNPALIVTSISNFGQSGPYRDYQASELTLYAMGGMMYITGAEDREPLKHGLSQAQYGAGENAAIATLAALQSQRATGVGQQVDISLMETVASLLVVQTAMYSYIGAIARRQRNLGRALQNVTPCADGYVAPVLGAGADWAKLAELSGIPDFRDPKFSTAQGRAQHADEVDALIMQWFAEHTKEYLFHTAQAAGFAFGLVQDAAEIAACPQLDARGYFVTVDHPVAGRLRYPGTAFRLSETPMAPPKPAPLLGQHNEAVFGSKLGFSRRELVQLRQAGVV